jgi:N-acetyl-gamma-glutamyl-phosphate reductase common form
MRAGVVGARGYVGAELLRLLAQHPELTVDVVTSTKTIGQKVRDVIDGVPLDVTFSAPDAPAIAARDLDVVFLGLPNGEAAPWARAFEGTRTVLVDLSADHRFDAAWVYGQPERKRAAIRSAKRIANPGCYATAAQLAIEPLRDVGHAFTVFGVSGHSGAGATPSPRNDPAVLKDNLLPYSLVDHTHERELRHELATDVRFVPHVAPFFRGITVTVSFALGARHERATLDARFRERWGTEPMITLSDEAPLVRDAAGMQGVRIGGLALAADGLHGAVVATIDNLLGGAATQALRNANLALGLPELMGVPR